MKKTAVILFNLGGPDQQSAVKPFLFNLFYDRAVLRLPNPFRFILASLFAARRDKTARAIYAKLGGGSPILKNTKDQAQALDRVLNASNTNRQYKSFIAMRYWHPFSEQTALQVKAFAPDEMILLPLYPQFSTTTTASSFADWQKAAFTAGLKVPMYQLCCYPSQDGFIRALATATRAAYDDAKQHGTPRILFSAHGLPEKIIKQGDPYQYQCEKTAQALRDALNIEGLDSVLCFQSRVGPLQWIKPATDDEVKRACRDKVPVVVVPIAFTSDHSETLVELDIEYRLMAEQNGVPFYAFVPAVGTARDFIDGLAQMVGFVETQKKRCVSEIGARLCPQQFNGCPHHVV
jgi:ferrochelatase